MRLRYLGPGEATIHGHAGDFVVAPGAVVELTPEIVGTLANRERYIVANEPGDPFRVEPEPDPEPPTVDPEPASEPTEAVDPPSDPEPEPDPAPPGEEAEPVDPEPAADDAPAAPQHRGRK